MGLRKGSSRTGCKNNMANTKRGQKLVESFPRRLESRESSGGLRELESAIRSAYVTKELQAQIKESEAARLAVRAQERLVNEAAKKSAERASREAEEAARGEKSQRIKYGLELKDAAASKEKERLRAREIEMRERRILEEVSRVMEEREEAKKVAARSELAAKKSQELRIFREVREIRRDQEAEKLEEEKARESEYVAMIQMRNEAVKKARDEREIARKAVIEAVAVSLLESRERKLELEAVLEDLVMEEKWLEEEMKLAREKERRRAARVEAAAEMERHRRLLEQRRLRHAIEEEEFAAAVMRRVLEDARIERLTAEARRRKQVEYRRALELVIAERRARRAEEMSRLTESLRLERSRNAAADRRVKKMRENLLLRHAGNVAQFIAAGALSLEEREIIAGLLDSGLGDAAEESATKN